MELIDNLKWRYATKQFDPSRKVSTADLEKIQEAVRLSASSYGLQLYKVLVISDPKLKRRLREVSFGQSQITDASHLFVFCNFQVVDDRHVDEYFKLKSEIENQPATSYEGYQNFIKNDFRSRTEIEKVYYTAKQCYLALGNLLAACAELKIDACPMEGFEVNQYNEILGLAERGLNAAVIATVGYRSKDDPQQYKPKVRKPKEKLFELI